MNKASNQVTAASFKFDGKGGVHIERTTFTESEVKMALQRQDTNRLEEFQRKAGSASGCFE